MHLKRTFSSVIVFHFSSKVELKIFFFVKNFLVFCKKNSQISIMVPQVRDNSERMRQRGCTNCIPVLYCTPEIRAIHSQCLPRSQHHPQSSTPKKSLRTLHPCFQTPNTSSAVLLVSFPRGFYFLKYGQNENKHFVDQSSSRCLFLTLKF